jgi:DNA-binding response OmpR family regulator
MPSTLYYILIVEADQPMAAFVQAILEREGYVTEVVTQGSQVLDCIAGARPDLVLLDWMLPGKDGLQLCQAIRQLPFYIPIIMLTARDDEIDKVLGLEIGADDYLLKPFNRREMAARVRATLRLANHGAAVKPAGLIYGSLEIDRLGRSVRRCGQFIRLTPKEFDLLELLASNPGRAFERKVLLERIWGYQFPGETRTVDVHIQRLRQRIEENPRQPRCLVTVRNVGYKFMI